MTGFRVDRTVSAPPSVVFQRAIDFEHAHENVRSIVRCEVLTEGPVGLGTRIRETRRMFGREATEEMEISRFEPGKGYTLECVSHGCHYKSDLEFEPDGRSGTRMSMTFEAKPLTMVAKLMAVVTRPLIRKMAREVMTDLDDLAASVLQAANAETVAMPKPGSRSERSVQ